MAANKRIAFATCSSCPDLAKDDSTLAAALVAAGHQVEAAAWDDISIDWGRYDAVIIRSTWNYHLHPQAFLHWLRRLESYPLQVANPVDILEWNMDKSYLADLRHLDVPLPPTLFLDNHNNACLDSIFQDTGWQKAVIKPCISATAHNTWITTPTTAAPDAARLRQLLHTGKYMIQEFMDEVESDGEYSLIFFGQQYSHAVKKTAKKGDFRVQEQFGGHSRPSRPGPSIIRQATAILDKAVPFTSTPRLLYARVDGVMHKKIFTLMELELVEPSLFINGNTLAIQQFAYFFNSSFTAAAIC
ncbi:hypothetical protein Q4E93_30380 [Flavitalea sp. BT771]|uniref:ATP-grasp domain-containing protein n=1 Tax=Flavitalea sp. BT771 TaxID=3063329 RepID=UPI0026E3E980|nr:hypothetical protein [Flavitalea sp. BT771]MDO6434960.1 hypothetical protein [Flavitalea sp. BT771]MDV6223860.1 hypothetical protein [Flavitalea sp. BT771]